MQAVSNYLLEDEQHATVRVSVGIGTLKARLSLLKHLQLTIKNVIKIIGKRDMTEAVTTVYENSDECRQMETNKK